MTVEHITIEQIHSILDRYRIGKKPLAKLLGWGETTIIRYVEGDTPTAEYSDKLKMILDNPGFFYEILQRNQENITGVAYKKCCKAVLKQMLQSRICIIAQYIINKRSGNISLEELQNYLYYIQSFSLALENRPMFEDDYLLLDNGMCFEQVYNDYQNRRITILELAEDALDTADKALIDDIIEAFAWYGPSMLKNLLTYEKVMLRVSRDNQNRKIVAKDSLRAHFSDLLKIYKITNTKDIHKYPDQRFLEIRNF